MPSNWFTRDLMIAARTFARQRALAFAALADITLGVGCTPRRRTINSP